MIQPFNILSDRQLEGFEIEDHVVGIESLTADHYLDSSCVTMGEATALRMLTEHMAALDGEHLANPVLHHDH